MTPFGAAAAAVPAAPTDPRELALHLEICRLQAELEGLEARIHQVEAARASGRSGYDPFVERAEELVERMVASLYVTGRAEIAEAAAASDADAEALIAEARARAQVILAEARGELASVLVHRAEAVDAVDPALAPVGPDTVLDLTEPAPPAADALAAVVTDQIADDTADQIDDDATVPVDEGPEVVEVPDLPDLPQPVTATAPVVEPVVETEPEPAVDPEPTREPAVEAPVAEAPAPPTSFELPVRRPDHEVPPGHVSALDAIAPHLPPMGPAGGEAASDRTDAAFEAWLAVAPSPATEPAADGAVAADDEIVPDGVRPSWVRPVEAAIALLSVAVLVVLALLLVG